jgi:hypothetical protein
VVWSTGDLEIKGRDQPSLTLEHSRADELGEEVFIEGWIGTLDGLQRLESLDLWLEEPATLQRRIDGIRLAKSQLGQISQTRHKENGCQFWKTEGARPGREADEPAIDAHRAQLVPYLLTDIVADKHRATVRRHRPSSLRALFDQPGDAIAEGSLWLAHRRVLRMGLALGDWDR